MASLAKNVNLERSSDRENTVCVIISFQKIFLSLCKSNLDFLDSICFIEDKIKKYCGLSESIARAIYFSRQPIPANAPEFYHHVGVYAYRRRALTQYVQLEPSYLEMVEKLEQLRALEAGMRIDVTLISEVPQSIDTPEDLERVTALFGYS